MEILSEAGCVSYGMCRSAKDKIFALYPSGLPIDPAEAEAVVDAGLAMAWAAMFFGWPRKRELLSAWFGRHVAYVSPTDSWPGDIVAQISAPDSTGLATLLSTVNSKFKDGTTNQGLVVAGQLVIDILQKEINGVASTDHDVQFRLSQVSDRAALAAGDSAGVMRAERVSQATEILTILRDDGLPPV